MSKKRLPKRKRASAGKAAAGGKRQPKVVDVGSDELRREQYVFRQVGKMWHVVFLTEEAFVEDSKGMRHIGDLLGRPNPPEPISALDLSPEDRLPLRKATAEDAITLGGLPVRQDILDSQAVRDLKKEIEEVDEQIDQAESDRNIGLHESLQEKKRKLLEEGKRSLGKGGRPREFPTPERKATQRVAKAIGRSRTKLQELGLEKLSHHLKNSIRPQTNSFGYFPGPHAPEWFLSSGHCAPKAKLLVLADGDTLSPTREVHTVQGAGRAVTLCSARPIAEGVTDDQCLVLEGAHDTNTVMICHGGTVNLNGAVVLGLHHSIELQWSSGVRLWHERHRSH